MSLAPEKQDVSPFYSQVLAPQPDVTQHPLESSDRNMLISPENEQAPQTPQEVQQPDIPSPPKEEGPPKTSDAPQNNSPTQEETGPVPQPDDDKEILNIAQQTNEAPQNGLPPDVRSLQGPNIEQPPQPNTQNVEFKEKIQGPSEPDSPKETEIQGDPY